MNNMSTTNQTPLELLSQLAGTLKQFMFDFWRTNRESPITITFTNGATYEE